MPWLLAQLLAGRRVPQSDRPISASGCQDLAVRGKRERANPERIPAAQFLALGYVPDADGAVLPGGCQGFAVGRKSDVMDRIGRETLPWHYIRFILGFELADLFARG